MSDTELACDTTPWSLAGFVNALTDIRRAGFSGIETSVELVPAFEDRVHILQEMLDAESLSLVTVRIQVRALSGGSAEEESERCLNVTRFLAGMEVKMLVISPPPYDPDSLEEEWLLFTNLLGEVGKRCEESKMRLVLNPQPGTIASSRTDLEKLLKSLPAKALPLAVDSAYLEACHQAPMTFLKRYRARLAHLYLSDLGKPRARRDKGSPAKSAKPARAGAPEKLAPRLELGKGGSVLKRFVDAAHAVKYTGWVTVRMPESAPDPAACAASSHALAAGLFDVF